MEHPVKTYINKVDSDKKKSHCRQCLNNINKGDAIVLRVHIYKPKDVMGFPFCCQNCHDIWESNFFLRMEEED